MKSVVLSVDPDSGSEHEICETSGLVWRMKPSEKGLLLYKIEGTPVADETEGYDLSQEVVNTVVEYDLEKGEFGAAEVNEAGVPGVLSAECDGVPAEITGGFDGEKYNPITVKTQYYTLSTEVTKYTKIFLWRDKVCIVANNDYSHDWLYTYDLTRRERLKMKFDGYSNSVMIQTEEGIFMMVGTGSDEFGQYKSGYRLCLLTPVQGTVYRLALFENCLCGNIGDTVYYLTLTSTEEPFEDYALVNRNTGNGLPDKLYWFKSAGGTIPRSGYGVYFEW